MRNSPRDIKHILKNISFFNKHQVFFIPQNRYWTIDVKVDIKMSNQELNTYLSYKVAQTTNKKVLFLYIKQQNSYLIFISQKPYIEKVIKRHPKAIITPLSIFYKSFLNDSSWAVFNINEDNAYVIVNINKTLKKQSLPISLSHIASDTKDIIKEIVIFINNMMPYIDKTGTVENIYFDSNIDIIQNLDGKNVYKDIKIKKINVKSFNPKKLALNFAKIKSFRFYVFFGLLSFLIGVFFSIQIYLKISNEEIIQNIKLQNKQSKTINHSMQTIKDIKNQILILEQSNNKQIILNSNFSNRINKILSSQDKIIKTIIMDKNNSYVK